MLLLQSVYITPFYVRLPHGLLDGMLLLLDCLLGPPLSFLHSLLSYGDTMFCGPSIDDQ